MRTRLNASILLLAVFGLSLWSSAAKAESLEDAWRVSLEVDHRLKASHETTESAKEALSAAKAVRLPSLTAEGAYTILDQIPAINFNMPPLPYQELPLADDNKFFASRVTVSLPLFTSGRISQGIDAASSSVNAARADESRTVLDLKIGVAEAYVSVLRASHALDLAKMNVASLESHAKDVENLFKKGFVARNDLLAVRVALADAREQEIQVRNRLDIARSAYNRLLGRSLTHPVHIEELTPEAARGDVESLTQLALGNRPELAVLKEQAQGLEHQAKSVRAATLPQVAVSGGFNYLENRFLANKETWAVSVGVKWDIFDGGVKRHEAGAILRKQGAVLNLKSDLESAIALQVRQAWLDVEETRTRLEVTREAIGQAEENLKVAKDRYRMELGTNTEVLDAETLRTRSLYNHNNATYDALMADLRLRRALGDL